MRNRLLACTAFLLASTPAYAAPWAVDATASRLTFEASQTTEAVTGSFKKFTPEIEFSETNPEAGKIHVTVEMSSLSIEGKDRAEALPSEDWFFVSKFPQAEFTSTGITKTGNRQYAATGKLTIKGITHDVTLPFTLKPEGTQIRAEGETTIQRNDYKIGNSGQFSNDRWVAFPVKIRYSILASPR